MVFVVFGFGLMKSISDLGILYVLNFVKLGFSLVAYPLWQELYANSLINKSIYLTRGLLDLEMTVLTNKSLKKALRNTSYLRTWMYRIQFLCCEGYVIWLYWCSHGCLRTLIICLCCCWDFQLSWNSLLLLLVDGYLCFLWFL